MLAPELEDLAHPSAADIQDIHDTILENGPGLKGNRPDLFVEALIGRVQRNFEYSEFTNIFQIAALYIEVVAKGHVFLDGNKRTALGTALTFLQYNGYRYQPDDGGLVFAKMVEDVAKGEITREKAAEVLELAFHIADEGGLE